MDRSKSVELFERSLRTIPGGVNSPVRAFKGVGGTPVFIERAEGARVFDADGNAYIDFVGSWGPMILGHANPKVVSAVQDAATRGMSFGAPTALEAEFAELIGNIVPAVEVVRLVNSGTEATMSAIRLARGFTGRPKIVKFRGCYHGHEDCLLVEAGSGVATLGIPGTPGVLEATAKETVTAPYNDLDGLKGLFAEMGDQIACVIIEPVAGNMGCIPPVEGFLEGISKLCTDAGALFIMDEVMTGFRVALGCAQGLYGIKPDLTTLGKVIGGGLPMGAFGGRADIMAHVAPAGPVYQAGTLSGNPLAVTAGLTTLRLLQDDPTFYDVLAAKTKRLSEGVRDALLAAGVAASSTCVGGMFSIFFSAEPPQNYSEVKQGNIALFNAYFHAMLDEGVYLAPSAFESGFLSSAHSDEDIDYVIAAAARAIEVAKKVVGA